MSGSALAYDELRPLDERPEAEDLLQVRRLVKIYPGSPAAAVNGVDFSVRRGEIFGLLGPNGAGKTTTISIICTLLQPTSGSVTIIGRHHGRDMRSLFGLAPQEIALYPTLTCRENLRYFGRLHRLRGRRLEERIDECLDLVGLLDSGDCTIASCSGGMKRRANLAAALLHAPEILVLDEPTAGVDPQSRNLIMENLERLQALGMTILYTTHYMEEAERLCSRIAVMDRGRIIAEGSPRGLVAETPGCGNLEELFLLLTGKQLRD